MSFKIIASGIFTTIQDLGRKGYSHEGRSTSGAMDEYAYRWSQKLLSPNLHSKELNALEVMTGLKLQATSSTKIAITGADLSFKINGKIQAIWQTYHIKRGDVLSFEKRISGQRAYLAVQHGFIVKKVYGSYATTLKEHIGAKLNRGDSLAFLPSAKTPTHRVKKAYIPNYDKPLTLRLLCSYQNSYFSQTEQEKFFNLSYTLTLQSDRMGCKLKGQAISPKEGGIISEGIAFGSVQIPKDGQPIVLLKEHQTIGGYPKIGTVLAIDCFSLAQRAMGTKVRFQRIDIEEAQKLMRSFLLKSF